MSRSRDAESHGSDRSGQRDPVRDVLISPGATAAQITATGVGSDFRQFTRDRDAAGTLLAGPATLNRSVRITLG